MHYVITHCSNRGFSHYLQHSLQRICTNTVGVLLGTISINSASLGHMDARRWALAHVYGLQPTQNAQTWVHIFLSLILLTIYVNVLMYFLIYQCSNIKYCTVLSGLFCCASWAHSLLIVCKLYAVYKLWSICCRWSTMMGIVNSWRIC